MGVDKWDSKEDVIAFDEEHGIEFPSIYGGGGGGGYGIFLDWNIQGTPTLVIIAPDRSIKKQIIWPPSQEQIIADVESFGGVQEDCSQSVFDFSSQTVALQIYPNPASDYCTLVVNEKDMSQFEVKVADLLGSEVKGYTYTATQNNQYNVPLDGLDPGIYFVSVLIDNKIAGTQKLIVR